MQFVNANVAKEAGRLHLWRERLWSRRYRSIVVADERAAHARLRYILAHGAKESLVWTPGAWPGPNCIAALTVGEMLRGTWFDRSAEYLARQRGQTVLPSQFAATAFARAGTRAGGHVSPLGLPTSLAVQRPGLTGAGYHGAGGAARQTAKGNPRLALPSTGNPRRSHISFSQVPSNVLVHPRSLPPGSLSRSETFLHLWGSLPETSGTVPSSRETSGTVPAGTVPSSRETSGTVPARKPLEPSRGEEEPSRGNLWNRPEQPVR